MIDFLEEQYPGARPAIIKILDKNFNLHVTMGSCAWRNWHCTHDENIQPAPCYLVDNMEADQYYGLNRCKRRVRKYTLTLVIEAIFARWKFEFKPIQELYKEAILEIWQHNDISGILGCFVEGKKVVHDFEELVTTDIGECPLEMPRNDKICGSLLADSNGILGRCYDGEMFAEWWNCRAIQTDGVQYIVNVIGSNTFKNILYNFGDTREWEEFLIAAYRVGLCLDELFKLILV